MSEPVQEWGNYTNEGKKDFAIDWSSIRRHSATIPIFVDNLLSEVGKYPLEDQPAVLQSTLNTIAPQLSPRVRREAELLVSRGADPKDALKLALEVNLKARRSYLFRFLIAGHIPAFSERMAEIIAAKPTAAERQMAVDAALTYLIDNPPLSYAVEEAVTRLKETGFGQGFIGKALEKSPRTKEQIIAAINKRLEAGEDLRKVMQEEFKAAALELTLERIKSAPVANGPDFCSVAAAIAAALAIAALAATAVSTVVSSSVRAAAEKRQRELNAAANRAAQETMQRADALTATAGKLEVLTEEELRRAALAALSADTRWSTAEQALIDMLRVARFGRTSPYPEETARLRQIWAAAMLERSSASLQATMANKVAEDVSAAQEANASARTRTLLALGAVGAAVLGSLVLKKRSA